MKVEKRDWRLYFGINSKYKLEEVYPSNLLLLELKSQKIRMNILA
jgi:hypothetical protein